MMTKTGAAGGDAAVDVVVGPAGVFLPWLRRWEAAPADA
jgi:hypothetical protein